MSVEIKQLVIKSKIANQAKANSDTNIEKVDDRSSITPSSEIEKAELLAEIQRICKTIVAKELQKRSER